MQHFVNRRRLLLQVGFDQCDGTFKLAPMLSEHLDPITHLAGLHILASVVYSRSRSQDTISEQLQEAGLYDAALALLKSHSHSAGQGDSSTHKDTLDWLEASQVGSPMAPLPEDHPVNLEAKGSVGSAKGSSSHSSSKLAFHPDCAHQASPPLLMTAQTMPLPSPKAVPATSNSLGAKAFPPEQEGGASGANLAGNAAAASAQGLEEDAERLSGDVTIADQVVLAALEVLFKLSSSKQHLQSFRCEISSLLCDHMRSLLGQLAAKPFMLPIMQTVLLLSSMQCQCLWSCCCITPYPLGGKGLASPASPCWLHLLSLLNACLYACTRAMAGSCAKVPCAYSKFQILNFGGKMPAGRHY